MTNGFSMGTENATRDFNGVDGRKIYISSQERERAKMDCFSTPLTFFRLQNPSSVFGPVIKNRCAQVESA